MSEQHDRDPIRPSGLEAGPVPQDDLDAVADQLGRTPRGILAVAHRCPSGHPSVVQTAPRLPDGTPFPTLYYVTCTRLASRIGTLEAEGRMKEMTDRLEEDPDLARRYRRAHELYLAERDAIEPLPTHPDVTAGGMPDRVKCLHVHVGHALAAGSGVNPFGDEALDEIGAWWRAGPSCS
ncbi:DUF501 domain-containing protein [Pseudonocardia nantongensis]|uniref:DUF501 domain-containing protein n=1 Tax=Pseudonocardia nantongensis TaxID=1181885 RepID=UPI0039795999